MDWGSGQGEAVNPAKAGTKAAAHYVLNVPGGGSQTVRLRLAAAPADDAFKGFEGVFKSRIGDADEFYQRITPESLNEDMRRVHRQALAGLHVCSRPGRVTSFPGYGSQRSSQCSCRSRSPKSPRSRYRLTRRATTTARYIWPPMASATASARVGPPIGVMSP